MTLSKLKKSSKDFFTAADIAEVLQSDAQSIRNQAHRDPTAFPFPVVVIGTRVKFPRKAFLDFAAKNICAGERDKL